MPRGRPRLPDSERKPRTSGPSGDPRPSTEQQARVRVLLRIVDPLNALGDDAGPALAKVLGVPAYRIRRVLTGVRAVKDETLDEWEKAVRAKRTGKPS